MNVSFDPALHEYRIDGVIVPGPSAVLRGVGLSDPSHYTPGSAEKGRERHEAIFLVQKGLVPVDTFSQDVRPYVETWLRFIKESGFAVATQESIRAHPNGTYCGTSDITGALRVDGRMRSGPLDIKTGGYECWHGVQLAAYREQIGARYGWILKLQPGSYRLLSEGKGFDGVVRPFEDPYWSIVWNAALVMYQSLKHIGGLR